MSTEASSHPFADRALPTWYDDAKFGIFVHWGPYSVPCYAPVDQDMGHMMEAGDWTAALRNTPYTEWYLNAWAIEGSPVAQHHAATYGDRTYDSFVEEFRSRSGGAAVASWAELFAQAGARYVVPVTKHHDGFLMWQSRTPNPFKAGWMAERDHIGELATAVRAHGMRLGLYYSGGLDWTFSPPPIDSAEALIAKIPVSPQYCEYAIDHVHELVERFEPSVLWNDIAWPYVLDPSELFAWYYERVPDGVVNDRYNLIAVHQGTLHADIATPEYSTKADNRRKWEVCRGMGRSFGYNRAEREEQLASVDELVWMLADVVGRGGNLLLNVGPTADGQIPLAQAVRLSAMGWWLRVNGEAIYGTRPWAAVAPDATTADGRPMRGTAAGTRRFLLVQGAPTGELRAPGIAVGAGAEVRMLGNDRLLPHAVRGGELRIELPDHLPASPATAFAIDGALE